MDASVHIARIDAWAFRSPVESPVATSFGLMYDRPAVFVRIEDRDGAFGWGEIWANWPAAGAEHRVNLLEKDLAPLILGRKVSEPGVLFHPLERDSHIRAVQCGEQGPFRQVIAGVDMALWDLFARRAGKPLRHFINDNAPDRVPTYASGIQVSAAARMVPAARAAGYRMFKLKVGFDRAADIAALRAVHGALDAGEKLAADANQAWDFGAAAAFLSDLGEIPLEWLEEPIPVFSAPSTWAELAALSRVTLAGGENLAGTQEFSDAIAAGSLRVIQPDVAKWGGITGCLEVAQAAIGADRRYCPHFLGGGLGLTASAELLAAVGGDGALEVDVNPNPLRTAFYGDAEPVDGGMWTCSQAPGLGVERIPEALLPYETLHREIH
ncbi:mandelate racemase/muconate lactonizing enzyme family protein [Oceanibium sediminis]|uniref:mandelate racemase/muconate lactonizing enzyme family protein n=1 Tax=Oceanibium sediminis TaxID=2026339 RepID=UPI000DD3846E|nr:mandelate racemase/muconate lactonizing enzyme family protein [Oceanibium sediminis]